mgnify:CR=1 FL=1
MIHELSSEPRSSDGISQVNDLVESMLTSDTATWEAKIRDADIYQGYNGTFAVIICSFFTIVFPAWFVTWLMTELGSVALKKSDLTMVLDNYLPAL